MTITDLDLIKQVLTNKDHVFTKSQIMVRSTKPVTGMGLVTTDGEEWALHRRIVNPAFHHENIKVQTKTTLQMFLTNLWKEYFRTIMN